MGVSRDVSVDVGQAVHHIVKGGAGNEEEGKDQGDEAGSANNARRGGRPEAQPRGESLRAPDRDRSQRQGQQAIAEPVERLVQRQDP